MMKKTLLATAVVATLAATATQAATVFENETLKVNAYGRINLGLENFDGDNEIKDIAGSRFGFNITNKISDDLSAFANAEFRYKADERHRGSIDFDDEESDDVFDDLRNTYVGLQGSFGKLTIGNFDSIYYSAVSSSTDIFQNSFHYRAINDGSTHARGDTIAYETADLNGLQLGIAAKHSANTGPQGEDEEWNLQAYASYKISNDLSVALAFNQNNEDANGAKNTAEPGTSAEADTIIGARVTYKLDALTTSLLFETAGDLMHINLVGSYNYGSGAVYASASQFDNGKDSGLDLAAGVDYRFSRHFRTYAELAIGNDDVSKITVTENGETKGVSAVTLGARFDW